VTCGASRTVYKSFTVKWAVGSDSGLTAYFHAAKSASDPARASANETGERQKASPVSFVSIG
jgi:hypothetical protein